ncbi:MAG: hypothetical protein N2323_02660 [candidate division WOR-3 bacterium]|nr:hypothetical protein [candidate division WOR-3 bacterium]MCX7836849.1 hypothetical protein [candidate division WOR-3 bacterium]MDW8114500.1 SpoIVB peptidase S55 domain-containing protein [candidate division WOR-3 bacterium]
MGTLIIFLIFNTKIMDLDSLKPKMKGYGLSTFSGILPDTFECEIIDIIRNVEPKRNLIIAKLAKQNLEKSGVVAGMSGSPVFINNKLIGAVAYSWEFQKEPICGITPIYEMLYPESFPKGGNLPVRNFTLPIALSGNLDEKATTLFKQLFPKNITLLFLPMGGSEKKEKEILPSFGYAVGVNIIDGDLKAAAIGTLTYINKDTIYAFGHPLFNFGEVELPLTLGKIHCVMPAYDLSFKLFSPIKEIGIINYDYQTAIKGLLNKKAKKIPVRIKIKDNNKKEIYTYEVCNHYKLIPFLLPICYSFSYYSFALGRPLNYTIKNKIKLRLSSKDKKEEFVYEKITISDEPKSWEIYDFYNELKTILENPLEKVEIENCEIESEFLQEKRAAKILNISLNKTTFQPKDEMKINITLQDFEGKIFDKEIILKIDLSPSQYFLFIGNPDELFSIFPLREERSFLKLLENIKKGKKGNLLKLAIYSQTKGIILKDLGYSLPLSLRRLKEKSLSEISSFTIYYEKEELSDYFITNSKTLIFEVKEEK